MSDVTLTKPKPTAGKPARSPTYGRTSKSASQALHVTPDPRVAFPGFFVHSRSKAELRQFVARHAMLWVRTQHMRGARGAIMVDIDDTLIDGKECVHHGFEEMRWFYEEASQLFPVHIVTARPDSEHANVMRMLRGRGFCIPPDRLHMLPHDQYYAEDDEPHVERFKWKTYLAIARQHGGVVARLGDKLWDVAHYDSLGSYLHHVPDSATYLFLDPKLRGTYSAKLPGYR